jgi:hypothetical protein
MGGDVGSSTAISASRRVRSSNVIRYRVLLVGCLVPALASCTATSPAPTAAGPTYTCCQAADINRTYQPGQTLTVHWIVVPASGGIGTPTQVELRARLTGPHTTVDNLKATPDDTSPAFTAQPVRPSGQAGEQPVSLIPIPPTAAPGYYNLITSVSDPAGSVSGASIIQVVPAT